VRADPDFGRPTSEDCLNLTVWAPSAATARAPRPVMVWIHGGGFLNGSSDLYDARRLATRGDIVVVTVNYRLGALGFLAHPALAREGEIGNYGLADQQAALRWVRDNIGAFGGDPDRVTVAGESAGAISVCDHLVAPESWGLFRAAIMQSGPCQAQADLPTARRISLDYAAERGCGPQTPPAATRECLLALPAERLEAGPAYARLGTNLLSGPVTGTPRLPVAPNIAATGTLPARVPVLIGSNADEFTVSVAISYLREGRLPSYRTLLRRAFGIEAPLVAAQYPPQRYGDSVARAYAAAVGDGFFACPIGAVAAGLARRVPVYAYEFDDPDAPAPGALRSVPFPVGAGHALELRYLFDMGDGPPLSPAQRTLSDQMIAYWSGFVTNLTPAAPGLPHWPRLDPEDPERLSLRPDGPVAGGGFAERHRCEFWAGRG
jgi:para-nitrobenzyl esterase